MGKGSSQGCLEHALMSKGSSQGFLEHASMSKGSSQGFLEHASMSKGSSQGFLEHASMSKGSSQGFLEHASMSKGSSQEHGLVGKGSSHSIIIDQLDHSRECSKEYSRESIKLADRDYIICCSIQLYFLI